MGNKEIDDDAIMRIDKWLWCARFFKTRASATEAINKGRVHSDGKRLKPSYNVRPGTDLTIRSGPYTHEITVLSLVKHRKSATEAAKLYREDQASIDSRLSVAAQLKANNSIYPRSKGRPTKRKRRKLTEYKKHQVDQTG